jgi:hypothetical protein
VIVLLTLFIRAFVGALVTFEADIKRRGFICHEPSPPLFETCPPELDG